MLGVERVPGTAAIAPPEMKVVEFDRIAAFPKSLPINRAIADQHDRVLRTGRQFGGQAIALVIAQDELRHEALEQPLFQLVRDAVTIDIVPPSPRAREKCSGHEQKSGQQRKHCLILACQSTYAGDMRFFQLAVLAFGLSLAAMAADTPKSLLHIVTLKYKAGATAADKATVVAATKKMAADFPGITRLWFKTVKVQVPDMTDVIVMEFRDEKAFAEYTDHPAHKAWEKVYLPMRGESNTQDVTN